MLWIDNSDVPTPLIYGSFTTDRLGINCVDPQATLSVTGTIYASGSIIGNTTSCSSDRRFKKDIDDLENTLDEVLSLHPVRYNWRTKEFPERSFSTQGHLGFIAQDIEIDYPELVITSEDGYKSVDYARITVLLTKAIQEQQTIIDSLKKMNDEKDEQIKLLAAQDKVIKNEIEQLKQLVKASRVKVE